MTIEGQKGDIDLKVDKKTFKEFVDKKVVDQGENFVNKLKASEKNKDKTKLENYKETFNKIGKETLKVIGEDMRDNFHTIDITNKKAPKLQTYIEAKKAFEEDIQTLGIVDFDMKKMLVDIQEFIDLKKINAQTDWTNITSVPEWLKETASDPKINILDKGNPPKGVMDGIITEIDKRINFIKEEKNKALGVLLNSTPSLQISQELFDKNQIARDALIVKNRKNTDTNKGDQQLNYEKLLGFYGNAAGITSITGYEGKKYPNTGSDYIQITGLGAKGETIQQDIKLGESTDVLHRARAEAYKGDAKRSDGGSIQDNLNELDGKGSYAQFENILKGQEEPVKFLSGLLGKNLLEGINTNKPKSDGEAKTNRYYGVILDYIVNIKDEGLLSIYLNHVVVGNAIHNEYLGTNRENQKINLHKITDKWTIDPTSNNERLLTQIKLQLAQNTSPKNFQETLSKGLDSLIDAFGPLLFSVLKMFGFGKGSLLKMFPHSLDKINEIFSKEYHLSDDAKLAVSKIIGEYKEDDLQKDFSTPPTGDQLKKSFTDNSDINDYIDKFTTDTNYYQYLNISVFKQGLDKYNKEKKVNININDIVTITTDSDKKQSITEIKDNIKDMNNPFRLVMQNILKDGSTRARVAAANAEITTSIIGKVKDRGANEYFKNIDEATTSYGIKNKRDIARYLTASLFSNKDLSYVMTENRLSNGLIYQPTPQEIVNKDKKDPETPKATLLFLGEKTLVGENNIVTTEGGKKKIHEIIDMNKAPIKIQITRKDGKTIIIGTLKENYTDAKIKKPTKTYIDDKGKRTITLEGDKISLPETVDTPEIKIADTRKTIKTELNKEGTKIAKTSFESPTYILDDKNAYQIQIGKISNLFTGDYKKLISETNQTTFKSLIKDNTSEFKNMFTYMSLKQNNNKNTDENFKTDKLNLTAATVLTSNTDKTIDITKQKFALKEATDTKTIITVAKNSTDASNTAKEGTITLATDDKGKLTVTREEISIKKPK